MNWFYNFVRWAGGGLRRQRGEQIIGPATSPELASPVTFDTALQLSAVWACVKLLSETVASLPFTVYRNTDQGREAVRTHQIARLFGGMVNRYQNRIEFLETLMLNLVMYGNAYCLIQRLGGDPNGPVIGLLPLMSSQVRTTLLADGSVVHEYHHDAGVTVLASTSVWHVKLMGNGIVGMSPLEYQRQTLGIAQAAEGAVTKIYRNGAKPSGVLSIDRILTPEQRAQVRRNFDTLTTSDDDRLLVLEAGMKFDAISMSPQDIELLASRKYQVSEICRWYGVPSVMVNDNNGTSVWGSGIEQIVAGFYKVTLRPILEKLEASMMANFFSPAERRNYEVEFDFEGLLRADMKSRFDAYRIGVGGGFIKPNEARRWEGLMDAEGGDTLFIQGATVPITQTSAPAVTQE